MKSDQWFELAERHGVTIERIKMYCRVEVDDNWPVASGKEEMEDQVEKALSVGRVEFAVGLLNQINKWEKKKVIVPPNVYFLDPEKTREEF